MNTEDTKKKIAYELTMEFIRQNNSLKHGTDTSIPDKVKLFEEYYNSFKKEISDFSL